MARSKKIAGGIQFTWSEEKNAPTLREVIDAAGKEFGDISPENLKIKVEYGPHNVPTFLQILKK